MKRTVAAWMTGAALVALPMTGCGDDDTAGGDAERYCELVAELEAIGEEVFADVPEDADEAEFAALEAEFVERADDQLTEMVDVAPEEIADDVEAFTDAMRVRATGEEGEDVGAAEERILAFEEANC